jgi:hypothetical protein
MTQARNKDLWGDIPEVLELTPRDLMREQAAYLEQKTKGLLTVDIDMDTQTIKKGPLKQLQTFYLVVPTMKYRYELFSIYQRDAVQIYPVKFHIGKEEIELQNEAEFISYLQKTLSSEKTKRIVGSLLAQAKSA